MSASIKCGNCGETHGSVYAVRECYRLNPNTSVELRRKLAQGRVDSAKAYDQIAKESSLGKQRRERDKIYVGEGFYKKGNQFYKVQIAHHGSGRLYAKVAVGDQFDEKGYTWEYSKGAIFDLRPEHKLTAKDAAEFGALYGRCIRCGRILTREESIERAMGPVCSGKLGL